ncbi:hypothetical protein EVAR_56606_1 [Eumeta japonica]|uniref:Uncharacterized protein n=1 Tax=Eumeta variegata TaxID=151549 RepID=A0A4C1YZS6_EUMVA|nr:hypothetical protein EVAR_56606_1 [Eumeta japonica]
MACGGYLSRLHAFNQIECGRRFSASARRAISRAETGQCHAGAIQSGCPRRSARAPPGGGDANRLSPAAFTAHPPFQFAK